MAHKIPTPEEVRQATIRNMVEFAKSGKSGIFANQNRENKR